MARGTITHGLAFRTFTPAIHAAKSAWWFDAPRENFTAICEQQYADHMKGSYGDKVVSGAVVVGYLEGSKKQKGAK